MQLSDSIDPMAADDRDMRHAHAAIAVVVDDGQAPAAAVIAGVPCLDRLQKITIDQVDDLQVPRQQPLEHGHGPGLERLRQQSVVGVRKHGGGDLPAFRPRQAVLIQQQAHQLRNRHGRMRVVQLDRYGVGQRRERTSLSQVRRQDVLQAGADEEILLFEPQLLALGRGIVRIQHAGHVLCFHLLLHGGRVVAGIEGVDMKRRDCPAGPEAQMVHGGAAVARNQLIESDRVNVDGIHPAMRGILGAALARPVLACLGRTVLVRHDPSAESHGEAHASGGRLPDIAQTQPAAGDFPLPAVGADDLREDSIVITNAVAHSRVMQCGQGIQEARRQTAQTAVTQARIDLLRRNVLEFMAQLTQRGSRFLHQAAFQAGQCVHQRAPRKIFHGEIAHPLHVRVRHPALRGQPAQCQLLAHRQRQGVVDIPRRRRLHGFPERPVEPIQQSRL